MAPTQLYSLLQGGGFNFRKWNTNNKAILQHLPDHLKEAGLHPINFDNTVKTLGLYWNSSTDTFQIKVKQPLSNTKITKRNILSEASKIFDPLGWLAPVVIRAKILLQDLWASGIDWDTRVHPTIEERWHSYTQELPLLEKITINRWINYTKEAKIELHGFCDASSQAYAAIVYVKIEGTTSVIAAKTKVAPLSQTISLPRLELNAAVLLSKLLLKVRHALELKNQDSIFCWTDSMAALGWIKGKPQHHKTFVANRITEIQSITNPSQWHHVVSSENPADCASRGINPSQLLNHALWWEGPTWLKLTAYPITSLNIQELELAASTERKSVQVFISTTKDATIDFNRFSSFQRLIRTVAYCHRFISNTRSKSKDTSQIQPEELMIAAKTTIRLVQAADFKDEIEQLRNQHPLSKGSTIMTLHPFLDGDGLLRVGGRLNKSNLTFNEKHPLILPRGHQVSKLIIREAHHKTLHGGNQATLAYIRQRYWLINAKNTIRHMIRNCITCARYRKLTSHQLMGILPPERVTPAAPFTNSGVDYAGPITLKLHKGRCSKTYKGYIAIFICMATKAIHLELVSDLTTEAFLAAFKRFTSRRGLCHKIFSDCGTNFVGANRQLAQQLQKEVAGKLAESGTEWRFIPPGSPHFGGLWEAGVKSTKHHLRRILGGNLLTFEELTTTLYQIEACLNSRPLAPLSNDIDDDTVLTPGHFLIGRPIIAAPEPDMTNVKTVTRWNLITKIAQQFWKQWCSEYLSRLQKRPKWLSEQPNIKEGELVVVKDEQLSPTKWPLARVIQLHHGSDGLVRVVTLKHNNNIVKRNITKVCRLPVTSEPMEDLNPNKASTRVTRSKTRTPTTTSRLMNVLTMLLVIGTLGSEANNNFQLTQWNNSPGIYFEEVGTLQLLASRWKLVVHYDLSSYWKEISNILNYDFNLNATCQNIKEQEDRQKICEVIHQQLNRQITNINQQNRLIQKFNRVPHRFKRGAGDTVGFILGDLFGVLTQREAEHYEEAIARSKSNEDHLMNLMRNQTSIIDATINIIKHDHEVSTNNFKLLQENIQTLNNTSYTLAMDNLRHNKIQSVLIYAFQIMLVTKELQDTQNAIIDVLTNSQHGRVHPLLLTPRQLELELRYIMERIPSNNQLPGGNSLNNLVDLYRIMSVKYRVTNNKIIFLIQIPLAQVESFQIFNQLAVPAVNKNMSQYIKPSTKYFALNKHKERFAPMTAEDFKQCIFVKEEQYICDISPIYNKQSEVSACEINLLQHNTNIHPSCRIESTTASNTWVKTRISNQWIFSLIEETKFDLTCGSENELVQLRGTGLIRFKPNCVLRGNSFIITPSTAETNLIRTSYIPALNLTFTETKLNVSKGQHENTIQELEDSSLTKLQHKIQKQQEEEQLLTEMNQHDIHHYTVSYTTIGIFIILFVVVYYKLRQQKVAPGPCRSSAV